MKNIGLLKKIPFVLAIAMLVSVLSFASYAAPVKSVILDVTTIDNAQQKSFKNQVDSIQGNKLLSDTDRVTQLTKTFFEAKAANFKDDSGNLDVSMFLNQSNNKFNCNKIINLLKTEKGARQALNCSIISDKLTCNTSSVNITADSATVTAYVVYVFQYTNRPDKSAEGINYTLNFKMMNGNWLISSMTTDDEKFRDTLGSDSYDAVSAAKPVKEAPLDAKTLDALNKGDALQKAALQKATLQSKVNSAVSRNVMTPMVSSLNPLTRSYASTYAYTYSCDDQSLWTTSSYNSNYPSYNPRDCQNFASQCIWYGLGGTNLSYYINNKLHPMISSGSVAWYESGTQYDASSNWISCGSFWDYVNCTTSPSNGGLYGLPMYQSIAYAEPGDTIQCDNGDGFGHTYIVYAVTGTYGAETADTIYVCAHTANIRNETLHQAYGATDPSYFRTVKIWGVYYP